MLWWRGWRHSAAREARSQHRLAQLYATLAPRQLSYDEPGMTGREDLVRGFRRTLRRERVGNGGVAFRQAREALWRGRMHQEAGLGIFPRELRLSAGTDFMTYVSFGPLTVVNPCRAISVLDEPLRAGLTYGTLAGHPLCGEEEFVVELEPGGTVWLVITAVSKPSAYYARMGAPLVRWVQSAVAHRFTQALRSLIDVRDPTR